MKAVIYARLSRNRDGEKSATLEYQEEHSREIAKTEGWTVTHVLEDDDLSGTKGDRPGFQRLTQLVVNGEIDWIIFQDTDRLARDQEDAAMLSRLSREHDVHWRAWSGEVDIRSAQGRMIHGVRASMDQFYSDLIGDKVKDWHEHRAKEGKVNVPGTMFGERSEAEAEVVRELAQMALKGTSLKAMCRWLNGRGIKTTRGNDWSPSTVRDLLKNPRLAGILVSKGEEVGEIADYEPILDRQTHEKLKLILTNSPVYATPPKGRKPHLLTGILICSSCGHEMRKSSNGQRSIYRCVAESPCPRHMTITADNAEDYVVMEVLRRVENDPPDEPDEDELNAATLELAEIREKRLTLTEAFTNDLIDRSVLDTRLKELKARESEVKDTVSPTTRLADMGLVELFALTDDPEWREIEGERVRTAIQSTVEKVVVHEGTPGGRFDSSRLRIHWSEQFAAAS